MYEHQLSPEVALCHHHGSSAWMHAITLLGTVIFSTQKMGIYLINVFFYYINSTNLVLFFGNFFSKYHKLRKIKSLAMNECSINLRICVHSLINPLLANLCFPCNFFRQKTPQKRGLQTIYPKFCTQKGSFPNPPLRWGKGSQEEPTLSASTSCMNHRWRGDGGPICYKA